MDRAEAARLLGEEMTRLAGRSHDELVRLVGDVDAYEVHGANGVTYQVEVNADWVDQPGGPILVYAGIDDGTLRGAFRPVTDGFRKDPDGSVPVVLPGGV